MAYWIKCRSCGKYSKAINIVELIKDHTDKKFKKDGGMLKCSHCKAEAHIFQSSKLQEQDETWERYVRGVIRIQANPTYSPYVFLTANEENGEIDGMHFGYFKDLRKKGGKLKHGAGPGGAPVFRTEELFLLIERLIELGCLNLSDLDKLLEKFRRKQ